MREPRVSLDGSGLSVKKIDVITSRLALTDDENALQLLESPENKRRWPPIDWNSETEQARRHSILGAIEDFFASRKAPVSVRSISGAIAQDPEMRRSIEMACVAQKMDLEEMIGSLLKSQSVASSCAQRFTSSGSEKRRVWEAVWHAQRLQDNGEAGPTLAPPPYCKEDFSDTEDAWQHRGKLDVPKERFVAYPTATPPPGSSGAAGLVFGWAGWTHLEQLQAAIALWQDEWAEHGNKLVPRATREALEVGAPAAALDQATRTKLLPILQTMVDLLVWVRQWHNDDGETADEFDSYVDEQCRLVEMSREQVHLWRMPAVVKKEKKTTAKKAPKKAAKKTSGAGERPEEQPESDGGLDG
jgi:hypothetical protein